MKDREIEVKFIINQEIRDKIIEYLSDKATVISKSHLIDTYYIPSFKDFEIDGVTIECVRIRENHKGAVLCYKKIHLEADPVYCDEFETLVENKEQMEKILFALGFSVQMVIDKSRISYSMNDFEFDFDSVKNLGELLEIELNDSNKTIEDIYSFVKQFGLTKKNSTTEGIQNLMKKTLKD